MTDTISVLGDGFVRLVDHMGDDWSIVRAARVSTGSASDDLEKAQKLLRYLMKHGHTSPFEHGVLTFHVRCPIFVREEWFRHRHWSFNAESGRYKVAQTKNGAYVPTLRDFGGQPKSGDNQQGRAPVLEPGAGAYRSILVRGYNAALMAYDDMIRAGCAREIARMVLPLGTWTEFYGTVKLWNLLDFLRLREDEAAQYEIRMYARALRELATPLFPVSFDAWDNRND